MIYPNNMRLQRFHYLAALSLYVDFFVTCFLIGNYEFQSEIWEYDEDFLNHESIFFYLIFIQGTDILITFFKVIKVDGIIKLSTPYDVAANYLKIEFFLDVISVYPF
jgi:hypothetical protein